MSENVAGMYSNVCQSVLLLLLLLLLLLFEAEVQYQVSEQKVGLTAGRVCLRD